MVTFCSVDGSNRYWCAILREIIIAWCLMVDKQFERTARAVSDLKAHLVLTTEYVHNQGKKEKQKP
jgi:hypothetical protein